MKFSAAKLRQLRKRYGWTQCDLAEHLEVDPMTVSRWERGSSIPRRVVRDRLQLIMETAAPTASTASAVLTDGAAAADTNPGGSVFERIDELVRVVGLDTAVRALRELGEAAISCGMRGAREL